MPAETARLIGEKPATPDGAYQPLSDSIMTRAKLKGLLEKRWAWNRELFEVMADTFTTIKKTTGDTDHRKPIQISDVSIGYEELASASKKDPIQKVWVHYPNSRDNLKITFSRHFNGEVTVLVNSADDNYDADGHLRCMNHRGQQLRPPARGISISQKDGILALLSSGLK